MKKLITLYLLLYSASFFSQTKDHRFFCDQVANLQYIISENHVAPKPVDDSLSAGVYKLFIQKLNETYWYFLKSDMDAFDQDRLALDDYIQNGSCDFIDKYVTTYSKRLEEAKRYVLELKEKRPDYSGKDS